MDTNENDKNAASSISSDLIRGHINTIILRTLYDGDKYGYEIINEIEEKSKQQYSLKQPTLYSALKRLESQDYVTSYWGGASAGGRRKYFQITEKGRKIVEQNLAEWEYSRTVIDSLISERDYDFSNPPPTGGVDFNVLKKTTTRVPLIKGDDFDEDTDFADFEAESQNDPADAADAIAAQTEEKYQEIKVIENDEATDFSAVSADDAKETEPVISAGAAEQPIAETASAPEYETSESNQNEAAAFSGQENQTAETASENVQDVAYSAEYDTLYEYEQPRTQAESVSPAATASFGQAYDEPVQEQPAPSPAEPAPLTEQEKQRIHENYQALIGDDTDATSYYFSQVARKDKGQRFTDADTAAQNNQPPYYQPAPEEYPQEPIYEQPYNNYAEEPAADNYGDYAAEPAAQDTADMLYANKPPAERNYKSLLTKLYENTQNQPETAEEQPAAEQAPVAEESRAAETAVPQPKPEKTARTASNVEFYDLEEKAENEGLRITTSNGSRSRVTVSKASGNTFDKGRVLFITAIVVFAVALIESIINICLKSTLSSGDAYVILPFVIDFVMLGVFLFLYLRGYGKNSRKTQSRSYISASLILYANLVLIICVIAYLIIWFGETSFSFVQVLKYAIFPCIYAFNIPLFALLYNYNCNKQ